MQYNDTSTKNGLLQDCERWCSVGDAGITGDATLKAQFTASINHWYHQVVTMILQSQDEWDFDDNNYTDYPVLTTPLVAGQRDYVIPITEKVLKIKRVDICYDGTSNVCYKAEPLDSGEMGLGLGNDTNTDARFSKTQPYYDVKGNAIWIYPMADATNVTNSGIIRIEWSREVDEFTTSDTTQEPGFDEPFHRMLSLGASYDYLLQRDNPRADRLKQLLNEYEVRLRNYYSSKQTDRHYTLKPAYINYE